MIVACSWVPVEHKKPTEVKRSKKAEEKAEVAESPNQEQLVD